MWIGPENEEGGLFWKEVTTQIKGGVLFQSIQWKQK